MRLYSSESFWSLARLWYSCCGFLALAVLGNAVQHGFKEIIDVYYHMTPAAWLVLAAAFAPGPIFHWLSRLTAEL